MTEIEKANNQELENESTKAQEIADSENSHNGIKSSKRRGRPKCFNEQEALEKATMLFWQYGFEATSIGDLTKALGITAPSLYSSFGDKAQLFQKCLDYYQLHETCGMDEIFRSSLNTKHAMRIYLEKSLKNLIQDQKPTGCMFVVSTMNCSEQNQQLQQQLIQKRVQKKVKILSYLQRAQSNKELKSDVNLQVLADYYATLLQGMSIQARDGATVEQLQQVVDLAMQTWSLYEL